jgi:hypothetical protein
MQSRSAPSDKRPATVENASYRWAYGVLAFGVLASVAYRGFVLQQESWDLLALVVLSGAVSAIYDYNQAALSSRTIMAAALAIVIAVAVGVALMLLI